MRSRKYIPMLMLLALLSCAGKAGRKPLPWKATCLRGYACLAQPRCGTKSCRNVSRWEAGVYYNPFPAGGDKRWKHWFVQPELRYWMRQPYGGHFFGTGLMYGVYNVAKTRLPFGLFKGYVPEDTRETLREWEYHTAITSSPPAGDWRQASA